MFLMYQKVKSLFYSCASSGQYKAYLMPLSDLRHCSGDFAFHWSVVQLPTTVVQKFYAKLCKTNGEILTKSI